MSTTHLQHDGQTSNGCLHFSCSALRVPPDTAQKVERPLRLLGDGDLVGSFVEYWGTVWRIYELNYLGDWGVERFEPGKRITSTVGAYRLLPEHPHYAALCEPPHWPNDQGMP